MTRFAHHIDYVEFFLLSWGASIYPHELKPKYNHAS
jgi:hypothetical protein